MGLTAFNRYRREQEEAIEAQTEIPVAAPPIVETQIVPEKVAETEEVKQEPKIKKSTKEEK